MPCTRLQQVADPAPYTMPQGLSHGKSLLVAEQQHLIHIRTALCNSGPQLPTVRTLGSVQLCCPPEEQLAHHLPAQASMLRGMWEVQGHIDGPLWQLEALQLAHKAGRHLQHLQAHRHPWSLHIHCPDDQWAASVSDTGQVRVVHRGHLCTSCT